VLELGMTMRRGGEWFYLLRPHTLLTYTYPLPYPYPTGMINQIASPSSTGSGIPTPFPSSQWIILLIKIKVFFSPQAQCCNALSKIEMTTIDGYGDGEERG